MFETFLLKQVPFGVNQPLLCSILRHIRTHKGIILSAMSDSKHTNLLLFVVFSNITQSVLVTRDIEKCY